MSWVLAPACGPRADAPARLCACQPERKLLDGLPVDPAGTVDAVSFEAILGNFREQAVQLRRTRWVAIALLVAVVVNLACTAGFTYAIVDSSKDTSVEGGMTANEAATIIRDEGRPTRLRLAPPGWRKESSRTMPE